MSLEEDVPSDDSQQFWANIYEKASFPILAEVPWRPVTQEMIN